RLARTAQPRKSGTALVMPRGGIGLDDQVVAFDVPQAAQLAKKRAPCASSASLGQEGSRDCRMENRYSLRRRPLSARRERPQSRRTSEETDELASPHMFLERRQDRSGIPHSIGARV